MTRPPKNQISLAPHTIHPPLTTHYPHATHTPHTPQSALTQFPRPSLHQLSLSHSSHQSQPRYIHSTPLYALRPPGSGLQNAAVLAALVADVHLLFARAAGRAERSARPAMPSSLARASPVRAPSGPAPAPRLPPLPPRLPFPRVARGCAAPPAPLAGRAPGARSGPRSGPAPASAERCSLALLVIIKHPAHNKRSRLPTSPFAPDLSPSWLRLARRRGALLFLPRSVDGTRAVPSTERSISNTRHPGSRFRAVVARPGLSRASGTSPGRCRPRSTRSRHPPSWLPIARRPGALLFLLLRNCGLRWRAAGLHGAVNARPPLARSPPPPMLLFVGAVCPAPCFASVGPAPTSPAPPSSARPVPRSRPNPEPRAPFGKWGADVFSGLRTTTSETRNPGPRSSEGLNSYCLP